MDFEFAVNMSFRGAKRRRIQKSLFVCPGSFADAQDDMIHLRFFATLRMTRIYVMCVIQRERNDRRIQKSLFVCPGSFAIAQDDEKTPKILRLRLRMTKSPPASGSPSLSRGNKYPLDKGGCRRQGICKRFFATLRMTICT